MPHQVSVFAENRPGKIEKITTTLGAAGINIRAITIADAGDYGIIKLLLDNPGAGCEILKEKGIAATLKEVVALKIEDRAGGLTAIASVLNVNGINVEDAYGFIVEQSRVAVFIFQVENRVHTEKILKEAGFAVMSDTELYMI